MKRAGSVLGTSLLAIGLFSAPAHAEPATLSGTITSDATGEPVSGCVTVYDTDFTYISSPCSDETGSWSLEVESGTAYKIEVSAYDGRHVGEWAQDAASFDEAQSFTAPATVDVGLQVGGTLAGTLKRADGSAAEGASVSVQRASDFASAGWTYVGASGNDEWSLLLAPGEYVVEFWDGMSHQWAIGQATAEAATRLTVTADETTRVDDQFLPGAMVRGRIVSDLTGAPISGACAEILQPDAEWQVGYGCADENGVYEVQVSEPGTFIAQFTDPSGDHVAEFSGDTLIRDDAATFEVTRETPAVVNASLATGAVITGRAVDARTGAPIADACPGAVVGRSDDYVDGQVAVCSSSDGRWSLKGLPAGSFAVNLQVQAEPRIYAQTWLFKAASKDRATLISVDAGATERVRDAHLVPGGTVSGVITGPTGEPVADAWVRLDYGYPGRVGPGEGPYTAQTDELGRYTITGVPPGKHTAFVYAWAQSGLAPEWSGNAVTSTSARNLNVKALKDTRFDAQLAPASTFDITVESVGGQPIEGYLTGTIYNASGDYIGDFDYFDGVVYGPGALPAGSFTLALQDESGEVHWFDGVTRDSGNTAVSLREGEQKAITFRLP